MRQDQVSFICNNLAVLINLCYDYDKSIDIVFRKGDYMPVRVRIVTVFIVLAVMILAFTVFYIVKQNTMEELDDQYAQALSYHQYLENKENDLRSTLSTMGTDSFVENQARTLYGYMKSDELRFVITNPEELYGTQN